MRETTEEDDDNVKHGSPLSLPILPLEVMEEILTRVPVKSLMRFKCVCSSWRSLISEQRFAIKHAEIWEAVKAEEVFVGISKNVRRCRGQCLEQYGVVTTSQYHLKSCCVDSLYSEPVVRVSVHDHELLGREYYHIVGTCHGLICFRSDNDLYLWNPEIKLHMRLPSLDPETRHSDHVTYGFGYDRRDGDYRVVALIHQRDETYVYSAKHGYWRSSRARFPPEITVERSKPGIYIKGTLNWAASRSSSSSSSSSAIVSYDLSLDTFNEVSQPVSCIRGCVTLTMGDVGGNLSMVCYCEGSKADIWVMKEFGEAETWMRVVRIKGLSQYVRPLWISDQCEVLLEFRTGLALYNSVNGGFRYPVSYGLSSCCNAKVYAKSLVSLI